MEYKIDATNKILGRLATEVAVLLRGKNDPRFNPANFTPNQVLVYNTDKIKVTGRKEIQKLYRSHSGYPGALKEETFENLRKRDSRQTLRHAELGMLPKNRLRSKIIKNLTLIRGSES